MPSTGFAALRDVVLADPRAQARLRAEPDWEDFVVAAQRLAEERGITLARADLDQARAVARRERMERWR